MEGSGNFDRWQIGRWEGRTGQELSELSVRVDAGACLGPCDTELGEHGLQGSLSLCPDDGLVRVREQRLCSGPQGAWLHGAWLHGAWLQGRGYRGVAAVGLLCEGHGNLEVRDKAKQTLTVSLLPLVSVPLLATYRTEGLVLCGGTVGSGVVLCPPLGLVFSTVGRGTCLLGVPGG